MKKILMSILIINSLFANEVINNKEIYTENGKAYYVRDEKIVSGVVVTELEGNSIYTTYENGNKIKERVLNNKREVVSEFSIGADNLINGKVNFTNEYEETIIADVKNGIINGKANQTYYGEFDFEGEFLNGVANGKLKILNEQYITEDKIFNNGLESNKNSSFIFKDYFSTKFINQNKITFNNNGKAQENNKPFTGLSVKEVNGYVSEASYYKLGDKVADFSFQDGFMGSAKIYKGIDSYIKYDFMKEINKGILSGVTNYSKEIPEGDTSVYFLNGQRMEGKYLKGRLMGKVIYYDKNNKTIKVEEFKDTTFTEITYYDYNKNLKKSEAQGKYSLYGEKEKTDKEIFYDINQKIESEISYNEQTAYKKTFFSNGVVKSEGQVDYYEQYPIGEWKEYFESGKIKSKYSYVDGVLDGKKYYYNEAGIEIKVENYNYGEQE